MEPFRAAPISCEWSRFQIALAPCPARTRYRMAPATSSLLGAAPINDDIITKKIFIDFAPRYSPVGPSPEKRPVTPMTKSGPNSGSRMSIFQPARHQVVSPKVTPESSPKMEEVKAATEDRGSRVSEQSQLARSRCQTPTLHSPNHRTSSRTPSAVPPS
jgi:hypothetical protein